MSHSLLAASVTLTSYITCIIVTSWENLCTLIQKLVSAFLLNIRHTDGHLIPGEPIKWTSCLDRVNFFGRQYSRKYGRVYHVWYGLEPVVILADVDAIRNFYRDHYSHKRDPDFSCCGPAIKDIIGEAVGVCHGRDAVRAYRGHFEPYFSAQYVRTQHRFLSRATDQWISTLPLGESIDLCGSDLTGVALKALSSISYGMDVVSRHLSDIKRLLELHNAALASCGTGVRKMALSTFRKLVPTWQNAQTHRFTSAWGDFHRKLLKEKEEGLLKDTEGIFFLLYELINKDMIELGYEQLIETVDEILLFNVDISFAATSFVIYDLGRHPEVQSKVREEVDRVLPGGEDPATLEELEKELPYLGSVVKESARMHPALGLTFPERTVKDVTYLAGYKVPRDTIVCIDPFSVNYDASYWPQPETFKPDRFATGNTHIPYSFFRFGLGPRKCLGYRLAQSLIVIGLVKLVQKFEISLAAPEAKLRIKDDGIPFFTPYLAPEIVLTARG